MDVSFVIPTRNQARFIRRCIDSCLAQRVPSSEILVVDGLSTDGTQDVLASYGDRISWTSERDSGQSEAVNKGIGRARGEIVAWINSDDYYPDPRCLESVLDAFAASPEVDVVYGDGLVVTADGAPIRMYRNRLFRSVRDLVIAPIGPPQPATFFRRQLFLDAGGLRDDLRFALDYELWMRLFPRARAIRRVDRTLACMSFHPGAKSTYAMLPQIREAAREKLRYARGLGLDPIDRLRIALGVGLNYAYWAAVRVGLRRAA